MLIRIFSREVAPRYAPCVRDRSRFRRNRAGSTEQPVVPQHDLAAEPPAVVALSLEPLAQQPVKVVEVVDAVSVMRQEPRRSIAPETGCRRELGDERVPLIVDAESLQ